MRVFLSSRESNQVYNIRLKFHSFGRRDISYFLDNPGIAGFHGRKNGTHEVILITCETGHYKLSGIKYSDLCLECPPGKKTNLT